MLTAVEEEIFWVKPPHPEIVNTEGPEVVVERSNKLTPLLKPWIESFDRNTIYIYDRGFPGYVTCFLHENEERSIPFVMRSKESANMSVAKFASSSAQDQIIEFEATSIHAEEIYKFGIKIKKGDTLKIRAVKVKLPNGDVEILLTNLFDKKKFPKSVFKDLYFKRWQIETNYNFQKNILQMENFSGNKLNSIFQDFYAAVFAGNLQSMLGKDIEKAVAQKTKHRQYDYKINKSVAVGLMKNKLSRLFLDRRPEEILNELRALQVKYFEPIRPGRSFVRRQRPSTKRSGKFQTLCNYKRSL